MLRKRLYVQRCELVIGKGYSQFFVLCILQ